MLQKRIADTIRAVRTSRGLTLAQMSEATGLSKALLSRIENAQVSPPIATLAKISHALDVPISIYFEQDEPEEKTYSVIRRNARKQVIRKGTKIGFTYYSLTGTKSHHLMEAFVVRYPVIAKEPSVLFDHPGDEFLFVLKGRMELVYGKERIRLDTGDAIHFDPATPHRGQNVGKQESECLVIVIGKAQLTDKDRERRTKKTIQDKEVLS
jgi:transcriptional regulator with XRE-family HTH domain